MKKSKKLLSVLLAIVMVFSAVAIPASAAIPASVTSLDALIQPTGLAGLAEWLLNALNSRKDAYIDTVLNFVCTYVEDINAYVPENEKDLFTSTNTKKKATYLLDFVDDLLAEANLEAELGEDLVKTLNDIGIKLSLNSVDGILTTIGTVNGVVNGVGFITNLGSIEDLDFSALLPGGKTMKRSADSDIQIVKNLIGFLGDNSSVVKTFFNGDLTLGILNSFVSLDGMEDEVTIMLEDLVYDSLLGAPDGAASHAESAYKDWTVDTMLVGALYKMLTGNAPAVDEDFTSYLTTPLYSLLTDNADQLYDKFLLGWLQNDLVDILKDFAQDNELAQYFNFDFEFSASEFDFAHAQNGILGEFNNVFVALLNKLLAADVLEELKLENGGNDKLNANLEKVIKFILPKLADVIDPTDFDFRKYTEEYVADKDLSVLAVDILKLFFPGWFKLDAAAMDVVEQMDTMGEVATMAVYYSLITFNEVMFEDGNYDYISEWNGKIFEEDGVTLQDLGNSDWGDICLSMAADAAMFGLAYNGDKFWFDFDMNDVKAAKAAGWSAEAFLDEIADWAIDMVKGIPAVTDSLNGKRGALDGYGPFYKLNVLLNEILDWSFLNNVSHGSFKLDIETLIFDGILNNVYEFDLAGILGLFAVNNNANNVLNKNTVPALLSIVDNLLNVLFSHAGKTTTITVAPTCEEAGYSVKCCEKCGLYLEAPKKGADALGHDTTAEIISASTCTEGGVVRYTCKRCDYVKRENTAAMGHKETTGAYEKDGKWYIGAVCATCGMAMGAATEVSAPDALEFVKAPTKVEYTLNSGEVLDLAGIVINAVYGTSAHAVNTEMLKIEKDIDLTTAGEQEITVSYMGKTISFKVTVVDPNAGPAYTIGDIDGDDKVTSSDARLALRASVKLETLDATAELAADVDHDGKITSSDARLILRASVGLEELK